MANELCILIRNSGAKTKATIICLASMCGLLVYAESAHLEKPPSNPKNCPTLEQFLHSLNVGSTGMAALEV